MISKRRMGMILTFAWSIAVAFAPLQVLKAGTPISFDDFITLGRVSDPQISPQGDKVAFVVTFMDEDENKSNSDIYLAAVKDGQVRKLTNSPAGDSQPRFSPDGSFIAFASSRSGKSQVWIIPTFGGEARQLTRLSTGASSPLWSPDGKWVFFTSSVFPDCSGDSCNSRRMEEKEKSKVKARIIDHLFYRHWDHWRDERRRHLFAIPVAGGEPIDLTPGDFDVPTTALGSYHDIAVSPDGKELCLVANTDPEPALSTNNDLFLLSLESLTREGRKEKAGGEFVKAAARLTTNPANDNMPVYSPNGRYIAYRAMKEPGFESDRYRLVLYDRKKKEHVLLGDELIEHFDRSVRGITWSPDSKRIYVTAADRGHISAYSVEVKSGKTRQLTEKVTISSLRVGPKGKRMVFLRQSATMPYEVFVSDKHFKKLRQLSHVNDDILSRLEMNPLEEFTFSGAGGTPIHGFLLKPPGFQEGRKYPLVFLIHGGPQGAWTDNFHWRWNYQMFASPGYVVAAVNPRGSTGYGQQFTNEISRDWGGKVFVDLIKGLDHVLSAYGSFIDQERLAAAGASFGGYMINWIEGHMESFPRPFKCLINHDGVYNLVSMYGSTEELWFPEWDLGGTPWTNPEGYKNFSPHTFAGRFSTPMLVIHGGMDFRVPFAEAMQVFTALQRRGIPSRMLYFPDEGHWVLKPQNARLWWKTVHEWLQRWIGGR